MSDERTTPAEETSMTKATPDATSTPTGAGPGVTGDGSGSPPRRGAGRLWWVAGIAISILVVVLLAPLASSDPDGLERVAEDAGFIDRAENLLSGILGDYAIPGIEDPAVSTILSGLLGLALLLGLMLALGRVLARRRA